MSTDVQYSATFQAAVAGSGGKTGIVVPEQVIAQLGAGRRPAVHVDLDGYFFAGLSNSLQRYHVDTIRSAKTPETRQRRIEKAVQLFRAGRKR